MPTMPHLVIMAAGTGGHIIPGLAVAREVQRRGWQVSWLGTHAGMENRLVPPAGIALDTIAFAGLRGKGPWQAVRGALTLVTALVRCVATFRRRGADAVLGMGGYICLPGGWAAALLAKPLMLVNADASLLLSNRLLARIARRIAFGFDGAAARTTPRAVVTGNPVRAEIEAIAEPAARFAGRSGRLRLLVVGGSLGARVLNETLPKALALMPADRRPRLIHQCGATNGEATRAAYAAAGLDPDTEADIRPFIDDMAAELAGCDAVICRAGAITVSELCAAGVASVLVPLVVSTTAHQRDNAAWLAGHSAAIHLPQTELDADRLAALIQGLDRDRLLAMAAAARQLARPAAAARVADELDRLVRTA
jgi:UDP-N-acetylglucosamine--N-acetylmuramyl-(pentapeptide) pyrophosphoryl-undecaprenol N-acetylglucosamine transferase